MYVRGAPLIGATAAWGIYLAVLTRGITSLNEAAALLRASRPTAVDLFHAIDYSLSCIAGHWIRRPWQWPSKPPRRLPKPVWPSA